MFLEISQISQENICASVSFLIKLQTSACNFIKKGTLAQVFSCEFCEISNNTFSCTTPLVAAYVKLTRKIPKRRHWRRSVAFIVNLEQIRIFFRCCCCWLWTSICRLGITYRPHFANTIDFDLQICWGLTYS